MSLIDNGKQKVNDGVPKKRGRPRKVVNVNADARTVVLPPPPVNLTLNDDETTYPIMHEDEQENMNFSKAMYYDNYQGPYTAGPSMFQQLQMGLKEAGATSDLESQPTYTNTTQNISRNNSSRRKEKNPSKVLRAKQTNLHLQDVVEPYYLGVNESPLPPVATQETQNEITANPEDAQKEIFTPTEDLSISQNIAGVKFRCPRPWLRGVETARC